MEYSVTRLAPFFGRTRANDVLLSHMITFLNDKEDAQLRNSFYENIVGVATYVGWQCSLILQPLLQQVTTAGHSCYHLFTVGSICHNW